MNCFDLFFDDFEMSFDDFGVFLSPRVFVNFHEGCGQDDGLLGSDKGKPLSVILLLFDGKNDLSR